MAAYVNQKLDNDFCFGLISEQWKNDKRPKIETGQFFVRGKEYPLTLAPKNFNIRNNQIPLKPVFPVTKIFLFL